MFRTVLLSIIRSLFTVHSAMVYVIQVCRQLSSRSCSKDVYKPVWYIPLLSVQWINPWWWTDELSETCRIPWQNEFVKWVHLVGFITKKSPSDVSAEHCWVLRENSGISKLKYWNKTKNSRYPAKYRALFFQNICNTQIISMSYQLSLSYVIVSSCSKVKCSCTMFVFLQYGYRIASPVATESFPAIKFSGL